MPYLALYSMPDISFGASSEFAAIPSTHPLLPDGQDVFHFIDYDARFYKRTMTLESETSKPGMFSISRSIASLIQVLKDC